MSANIILPVVRQSHKAQLINDWIDASETAINALFVWKACLNDWQTCNVTDQAFMQAVQQMSEAGLLEFLDASWADIDALRKSVVND